MKLLNTKSILDCTENEIETHTQECHEIIDKLQEHNNYDCAVLIKYFDERNKEKEPIIKQSKLYDCMDMIQYADIKNGVDFTMVEGYLTFICYGSEYQYNDQTYITTAGIQIRPYNSNRDFIQIIF